MSTATKQAESLLANVIVIEDDTSLQHIISEPIRIELADQVDSVADGLAAWEKCQAKKYDFIILDWKLPSLGGLGLLNRFRKDPNYRRAPILVLSGYLDISDIQLFDEYPCTLPMEKPFTRPQLLAKIRELHKEAGWYQKNETKVENIFKKLEKNEGNLVEAITKIIRDSPRPVPIAIAASRLFRENGHLTSGEALIRSALKVKQDSIPALNELGRNLLLQGKLKEAKNALVKAYEKSPKNLDRLCDLGQISLEELNTKEAKKYFNEAAKIDKGSDKVQEGKNLVRNIDDFMSNQGKNSIPNNLASMLNAIGITMVKSKSFDEGMEHYKSAMSYVTDPHVKAKLAYNKGLGYLRWQKPEEAIKWFVTSKELSNDFDKNDKYISFIQEKYGITLEGNPDLKLVKEKGDKEESKDKPFDSEYKQEEATEKKDSTYKMEHEEPKKSSYFDSAYAPVDEKNESPDDQKEEDLTPTSDENAGLPDELGFDLEIDEEEMELTLDDDEDEDNDKE